MGFFSWKTADTDESIPNSSSSRFRKGRPVYLLQPFGKPPLQEDCYEGYGVFGGKDALEWLAENNLSQQELQELRARGDEAVRGAGIMLDGGHYLFDRETSYIYAVFHAVNFVPPGQAVRPTFIPATYAQPLPEFGGKTANQLVSEGRFVQVRIHPPFPLKFSFSANAQYEDLPASLTCPEQGCFYE
jgi:hypothetical protein